jgi:hypothetical protein
VGIHAGALALAGKTRIIERVIAVEPVVEVDVTRFCLAERSSLRYAAAMFFAGLSKKNWTVRVPV